MEKYEIGDLLVPKKDLNWDKDFPVPLKVDDIQSSPDGSTKYIQKPGVPGRALTFIEYYLFEPQIDHEKTAILNAHPSQDKKAALAIEPEINDIQHPSHYMLDGYECIDIIKAVTKHYRGDEASMVSNIIKYLWRAPHKGTKDKDIRKSAEYMDHLIKIRNEEATDE